MINAVSLYRVARWCYVRKMLIVSRLIELLIFLLYNSRIPAQAIIGKGSFFAYSGIGVVIHKRCVIGDSVNIGPNVTIGGRSNHYEVPIIGNDVFIATGAKILGPIRVGNHVTIGANSVVIHEVPDGCVVAGVPAKVIKQSYEN